MTASRPGTSCMIGPAFVDANILVYRHDASNPAMWGSTGNQPWTGQSPPMRSSQNLQGPANPKANFSKNGVRPRICRYRYAP